MELAEVKAPQNLFQGILRARAHDFSFIVVIFAHLGIIEYFLELFHVSQDISRADVCEEAFFLVAKLVGSD